MLTKAIKYKKPVGPLLLLALLFYNGLLYSQKTENPLPVTFYKSFAVICNSYILNNSIKYSCEKLVPSYNASHNINSGFYDSLKVRASKHLLTRKLYDFVVVSGQPAPVSKNSESSDASYLKYSGKRIGKISIQRLSVFGSDINNPDSFSPNKLESLLNKTHLNTNEFIIRKNLLFKEGDTLSPLLLSDNERILRQLPYIDDSRVLVVPVSESEVNIIVLVKDIYSYGIDAQMDGMKKGSVTLFDKNILGLGHEFRFEVPFNPDLPDSPGFGLTYDINNISRSFINLKVNFYNGLGQKTYGFSLDRQLVSSTTRYAGGISMHEMFTSISLDTMPAPAPLKYNLQDYWIERSFLLNKE
jgi:outer membrane protein assembly factor BamA